MFITGPSLSYIFVLLICQVNTWGNTLDCFRTYPQNPPIHYNLATECGKAIDDWTTGKMVFPELKEVKIIPICEEHEDTTLPLPSGSDTIPGGVYNAVPMPLTPNFPPY